MDAVDKYAFAVRRLVAVRDTQLDNAKYLLPADMQEQVISIIQDFQSELDFLNHYFLSPKKTMNSNAEDTEDSLHVVLHLLVPHNIFWLMNRLVEVRGELSLSGSEREYNVKCKTVEALRKVRQIVSSDACSEVILLE